MNAADTSASSAIADWTPLAVVSRSCTDAEIDTFISDVSTTSTNIAIASRIASRVSPDDSCGAAVVSSKAGRARLSGRPRRQCGEGRVRLGRAGCLGVHAGAVGARAVSETG
jgi:hypothetical protein